MALKDVFKVSRKTFLDPVAWLGYKELKATSRILWSNASIVFTPPTAARTETFEAAMTRMKLSEDDIKKTANNYLLYTMLFVVFGGISFASGFYFLFSRGSFASFVLTTLVMILFLLQAFRYHFWYFQIIHRKLGCTFQEWWKGKIQTRKPKS